MIRVIWVDLVAIIIVVRSIYVGLHRGFFGEFFYILAICLAIVFGIQFYPLPSNFLNTFLLIPPNITDFVGFILIIIIIFMIYVFLSKFFQRLIKIEIFPAINRMGGLVVGFCRGLALSSLILLIMLLTPIGYITESAKTKSLFGPFLIQTGANIYKKSLIAVPFIPQRDLTQLLSGARPIKFKMIKVKRKDRLEEILQ